MARIAYCWELGNSIGHVTAGVRLAEGLRTRGHDVVLVLRDLQGLHLLPEAAGIQALQAPVPRETPGTAAPASYTDILRGHGYGNPQLLAPMIGAWSALFEAWRPDLVIGDFAPTALLAARVRGVRRVTHGNGFFVPPLATPIPPFRMDVARDRPGALEAETRLLASVNEALAAFGTAPLDTLARLFEADEHFLCTLPEIDHYGTRERSRYWGPRMTTDIGSNEHWPRGTGPRVLVYVQAAYPRLDEVLQALASRSHRVIATIPGLDARRRAAFQQGSRRLTDGLTRLDALLPDTDLLVCNGGDIAAGALMHGVPSLVLALHYEQFLTAIRLAALGAGLTPSVPAVPGELQLLLDRMLSDPVYKARARAFAARHPSFSPRDQRRRVIARIDEILAS